MSKPRQWFIFHRSTDGRTAKKNFELFKELMSVAITKAPSTVKFPPPDIEALQKENAALKAEVERLNARMDTYVLKIVPSLNQDLEHEREICGVLREALRVSCVTPDLCQLSGPCRFCQALASEKEMRK